MNIGIGHKGAGWDASRNQSRNATYAEDAGLVRAHVAARMLDMPIDRLHVLGVRPERHHVGKQRREAEFYDPEALLDAAALDSETWRYWWRGSKAAERRVLAHIAEIQAEGA